MNDKVGRILGELAVLTELDEADPNAFRVRAYRNAQRAVEGLDTDVASMSAAELAAVRGIGTSIASRIREYVDTGTIERLDQLRAAHPPAVAALRDVPGLGPKSIRTLVSELGIEDLDDLLEALDDGRVASLEGFGARSVAKLRTAIERLGLDSKQRRVPLADALPVAERLVASFEDAGAVRVACAGSARRMREDVGDLDVLVVGPDVDLKAAVGSAVDVDQVLADGDTKYSVVADGLQVDVRRVPEEAFGAALVYFTGSKDHNIRLRQRAVDAGWTLNEYRLAPAGGDGGDPPPEDAAATEKGVYAALGMQWVPPEIREDRGEIEQAGAHTLPRLLDVGDIQGDLHVHTDLSGDGRDSLEAMVAAAVQRGLSYVAVTDHAENLAINGVSRSALRRQRRLLGALEQDRGDVRLLHGAELNIGIDGSLDYDEAFLAEFDWLVASVHSHFDRGADEQTARVVAAMEHPSVTVIGHLTGRMIGRRPGIEIDVDTILDTAIRTGTALEINASLRRLEPPADVLEEAARRGVDLVVSTDAHAVADLDRMRHGVAHARRSWVEPPSVLNANDVEDFEAWLVARSGRRTVG